MSAAALGRRVREIVENHVNARVPRSAPVALLLSGGVDSTSCGLACWPRPVTAYTFVVDGRPSDDSRAAVAMAVRFGWLWNRHDATTDRLEDDVRELASRWGCRKKTQFECTWPFLRLYAAVAETYVVSGIAADGLFGLSRKAAQRDRVHDSAENLDRFRRAYFAQENPAGLVQQRALAAACGKVFVAPYLDPRLQELFAGRTWDELNRPVQKRPIVEGFPELSDRPRRHANLQLVAGVDDAFAKLLRRPMNVRGRTRVMDLLRDVCRGAA